MTGATSGEGTVHENILLFIGVPRRSIFSFLCSVLSTTDCLSVTFLWSLYCLFLIRKIIHLNVHFIGSSRLDTEVTYNPSYLNIHTIKSQYIFIYCTIIQNKNANKCIYRVITNKICSLYSDCLMCKWVEILKNNYSYNKEITIIAHVERFMTSHFDQ